jgi:hypothetical protein
MIKDPQMVSLVEEQSQLFINSGDEKAKVDVLKRIQKRQKILMKHKEGD